MKDVQTEKSICFFFVKSVFLILLPTKKMFPIRCYTCNTFVGSYYSDYTHRVSNGETKKDVLDSFSLHRICCRRMFLGHVHVISDLIRFSNDNIILDDSGTALIRDIQMERTVSCD